MARPNTNYDEKRQGLIKIAFDLFMKNGYENTSIQDIMNIAQISKGAMYHYFASKEDILDAVLNYIIDLDVARVEHVFNNPSLSALEKLIISASTESSQPAEEIQQVAQYIMQRPESIFDYRAREVSKKRSIPSIMALIKEGVEKGEFTTEYPEEMATFIYASSQAMGELIMLNVNEREILLKRIDAFVQLLTFCLGLKEEQQNFLTDYFNEQM